MTTTAARRRLAVVIPPANPTVAAELTRCLPGAELTFEPFDTEPGSLRERLSGYAASLEARVSRLRPDRPDGVLIACTGCSYPLGPLGDADLARRVTAAAGAPVVTAAGAVVGALAALSVTSVTLVSPYPAWLTGQAAAFLTSAGHSVRSTVQVPGTGLIYDLTAADLEAALRAVVDQEATAERPAGHAVLVTGTGAPSLPALDALAALSPVPLLSSNVASALDVAARLGWGDTAFGDAGPAVRALQARWPTG